MRIRMSGGAAAVFCGGLLAILTGPQSQTAHAAASGTIDIVHSRVYTHVRKAHFGHEHAVVGRVKQGEIHLGATRNAGSIVFDMSSFLAGTPEARRYIGLKGTPSASMVRQVNKHLRGPDVLAVRRYPTAKFSIHSVKALNRNSRKGYPLYRLDGRFTLHGVTRPLHFDAELIDSRGTRHLRGHFSIRQTKFGITPYSIAFGAVAVADELTIYGEIYIAR